MIIGLTGYARSGKDSVAEVLVERGFLRTAFADTIRAVLWAMNPVVAGGLRVQQVVDYCGWDEAKEQYPEVRALLQRLGAEGGRGVLGESVWVDATLARMRPECSYVVADVRYPNEADAVRAAGGQVWRVERPGVGPVNGHESETAMDGYPVDVVIANDGTLAELRGRVLECFDRLAARR